VIFCNGPDVVERVFLSDSTQINFSLEKQQSTVSKNISTEDGGNWAAAY
jgi:hypothetical protein